VSPGQEVVTAGVHMLTPGQKVRLYLPNGAAAASAPADSR
jgi:membrane fusion protein, multidrug efflux system